MLGNPYIVYDWNELLLENIFSIRVFHLDSLKWNWMNLINLYVDRIGVLISFIFADSELQDLSCRGGSWDLIHCPRCWCSWGAKDSGPRSTRWSPPSPGGTSAASTRPHHWSRWNYVRRKHWPWRRFIKEKTRRMSRKLSVIVLIQYQSFHCWYRATFVLIKAFYYFYHIFLARLDYNCNLNKFYRLTWRLPRDQYENFNCTKSKLRNLYLQYEQHPRIFMWLEIVEIVQKRTVCEINKLCLWYQNANLEM